VDVLAWYESVKYKVPKIHRMATYIFSIPPTQIQNEREFSLPFLTWLQIPQSE
jgi:hAT family C-terminal dimerisation region